MNELSNIINKSFYIEEVFENSFAKIDQLFGLESVLFLIEQKKPKQIILKYSIGLDAKVIDKAKQFFTQNNTRKEFKALGERTYISNQDNGINPVWDGFSKLFADKTLIAVPLTVKGKAAGFSCFVLNGRKIYTPDKIKLLNFIGFEVSLALEKDFYLKELEKAGKRFKAVFKKASDAIWLQDSSGRIILANNATIKLTGYNLKELHKDHFKHILLTEPEIAASRNKSGLDKIVVFKRPLERKFRKKNGQEAVILVSVSLLGRGKERVFLYFAHDITEERKLQNSIRLYAEQISKAHEEERKRIARELHDDTIQTLLSISHQLDVIMVDSLGSGDKNAETRLEHIRKQINKSVEGIRRFIQLLRPPTLEFLGLIPALRELCRLTSEQYAIKINFKENNRLEIPLKQHLSNKNITQDVKLIIYRIAQEAVNNIWKHSQATAADLLVAVKAESISIEIRDNGIGFNNSKEWNYISEGKLGLMGMRERANLLGGELKILSAPNQGTKVLLTIKL